MLKYSKFWYFLYWFPIDNALKKFNINENLYSEEKEKVIKIW